MRAHPYRWLAAALMLTFAVQPGLLPHPLFIQAIIGGAAAAQGYGLAALIGVVRREIGRKVAIRSRLSQTTRQRSRIAARIGAPGLVLAAMFTAHAGQLQLAARTDMAGTSLLADALGVAAAVPVAIGLVATVIGVRAAIRALARIPRRAVAVLAAVPVLALAGCGSLPVATAQAGTAGAANAQAQSSAQSLGGSLGVKGEQFINGTPDAASISAVTGRPARTPVRVYVGRTAAATPTARAALAVGEIARAGGFDRSAVLIDVPTGSGWVNPSATSALERLRDGDVTTVAMQYAASPSWLAYLRGGEGVQASVRALTDAIGEQLAQVPPDRRPRLLVYGESLGAWGGLRAYPGGGIVRRTDGALWVGVPGGLPIGHPEAAAQRILLHPDDPVPAWSPRLILRSSPAWPKHWLPIVSFWQATGDVVSVPQTPEGFGHKYGSELVGAWQSVLAGSEQDSVAYSSPGRSYPRR